MEGLHFGAEMALQTIPGQELLTQWSYELLKFLGVLALMIELVVLGETGRCNLIGVLIRGTAALATIRLIPYLGVGAHYLSAVLGQIFDAESSGAMWTTAFKHWIASSLTSLTAGSLSATILGFCTLPITGLVFGAKMVLMEIVYPAFFTVAVWSGLLSVPLSVVPGVNKLGAYYITLIEIALWPVVHAFLTAIFAVLYQALLKEVAEAEMTDFWETVAGVWRNPKAAVDVVSQSTAIVIFKFMALSGAYIVMTYKTPAITKAIVRHDSLGDMAGAVTAGAMLVTAAGASMVAKPAGVGGFLDKLGAGSVMSAVGAAAKGLGATGAAASFAGAAARGLSDLVNGSGSSASDMNARPVGDGS